MIFASDNWAGAAEEISRALLQNASGYSPAYGESVQDRELERKFDDLFERKVAVFFVGTGTAANSLALSSLNRPGGFVLCHRESHLIEDECGAPEFFTSGARLGPVDGSLGKISPASLRLALDRFDPEFVHHGQPMAVSLTQATEVGTVYSLDELNELSTITHRHGLPLHMDGARFANAFVHLRNKHPDLTPAEVTWKSGIDVLSFGATKNGCWCAEALVFFDPKKALQLPYIRKRAAQLFSKTRFIACQFHAYLEDGLWLNLAKHANEMAQRLARGFQASPRLSLAWECEANEVFVTMTKPLAESLKKSGAQFYEWPIPSDFAPHMRDGESLYRFVTSFATQPTDVDELLSHLKGPLLEVESTGVSDQVQQKACDDQTTNPI